MALHGLQTGDELYWYETPAQRIVWRTRVSELGAFSYSSLDEALDRMESRFVTSIDRSQDYLKDKPIEGYCLAFRVEALERMDLPRPEGVRFSQQGWERAERPEIAAWLHTADAPIEEGESIANPPWTRDEVVLALDVFVRAGCLGGNALLGKNDQQIQQLSQSATGAPHSDLLSSCMMFVSVDVVVGEAGKGVEVPGTPTGTVSR